MTPADTLAASMRRLERYRDERLMDDCWIVLRIDGRGFSKLTEQHFEKPFDAHFHELMRQTSVALMEQFTAVFAYTQSDEISLVLPPHYDGFDRRLEKLVSLSAATASVTFSLAASQAVTFDSRAWVGPSVTHVADYMRWRQADAARCALHTACYWILRQEGMSARRAHTLLQGASRSHKNELLFERGVNFNDLPVWQRRGITFAWESYQKEGFNPITEERVWATRRRLTLCDDIPMGEAFGAHILAALTQDPAEDTIFR